MKSYAIGELARQLATSPQTIRWYEQQGLMPPPARTGGGQRRYDEDARKRLAFIRHARLMGFDMDDIRALLELRDNPEAPCQQADELARQLLAEVGKRIEALRQLEAELRHMTSKCRSTMARDCRIIATLADHDKCLHDEHAAIASEMLTSPSRKRRRKSHEHK